MKLTDKEGLEIASTVKDVLEGKVKKETYGKKKGKVKKEVAQPRAKGEKEFHDLHDIEVSGEAPDGKVTKSKKGNYYKEAEEPRPEGEKNFKKKHVVKKSGEKEDGTVMKEEKPEVADKAEASAKQEKYKKVFRRSNKKE